MDRPDDVTESAKPQARTDWAEEYVEKLVSMPFISEFVFRSPRRTKNGKEVADLLISQGDTNIVFSQKCQDDPTSRSVEKNAFWVIKESKHALSQLQGGLKNFTREEFWCDHPRRGRVHFKQPLTKIDEAIVLIETRMAVDLSGEPDAFPLEHNGVPITYLSVNDFLNLVTELRTVPELIRYLKKRRVLTQADLRVIGDDKNLYPLYVLNDRHFDSCNTRDEARKLLAQDVERVVAAIAFKKSNDIYCTLLEHVAHELSVRDPNLPKDLESLYEPTEERSGYLKMQLAIADLELPEKISLGKAFVGLIEKLATSGRIGPDLVYGGFHSDAKPEWVFVFASSQKMERKKLGVALAQLGHGALAHYDKTKCLVIADRSGAGYEVLHLSRIGPLAEYQIQMGKEHFAKLKMSTKKLSLSP